MSTGLPGCDGTLSSAAITNYIEVDRLFLQAVSDPYQPGYQGSRIAFYRTNDGVYVSSSSAYEASEVENGYEVRIPGGIFYRFDTNGILQRISHSAGQEVAITYQSLWDPTTGALNPKIDRVTHSNGRYLQFVYTGDNITEVLTHSTNLSLTLSYDAHGDLVSVVRHTSRGSFEHAYEYMHRGEYSTHWLTKRVNPNGQVFRFEYADIPGPASRAIASYGEPEDYYYTRFEYISENFTRVITRRGDKDLVEDYFYDPLLRRMKMVIGPNSNNWIKNITYDANLNMSGLCYSDTDMDEHYRISMAYDEYRNLTNMGYGYNSTPDVFWALEWNQGDRTLGRIEDPAGVTVSLDYTNSLVSTVRLEAGSGTNFEWTAGYDAAGLITAITNANGNAMRLAHDSAGYITNVAFDVGYSIGFGRDELGHVNAIVLPGESGPRTISIVPDEKGRPLSVTYPDGLSEVFSYDGFGNLIEHVDTGSRTSSLSYVLGRLTSITRWLEGVTNQAASIGIGYDNQLNMLSVTDELGRAVERYEMDDADRVVKVVNLETQELTIAYGVLDFVKTIQRFDGSTVGLEYNDQGRISEVRYPAITNLYQWSANGLPVIAENEAGRVSNTWDVAGRLVSSVGPVPEGGIAYTRLPAGNVSSMAGVAGTVTYSYDAAERVTTIRSVGDEYQYEYGVNGLVSRITCTNAGISAAYSFNAVDAVTEIVWRDSASNVLWSFEYGYDAGDLITQKVVNAAGASWREDYAYDSLGRLIAETVRSSETSLVEYAYDLAGNRLMAVDDGITNVYTLATGNRLVGWGDGSWAGYDAAGNVTSAYYDAARRLDIEWNDRYQICEVRKNGVLAETYGYDALGRRIRVSDGEETNYFVYSGFHVIAEVDGDGTLRRSYTYGPGIDNLLSMTVHSESSTNTYYALTDHLGTVHAMADANGAIVESYRFDAWGRVLAVYDASGQPLAQSAIGNRYLWQGREYSWTTGLYYFRARWYDPVTGRWLSKDPIGISGGLNLYAFCGNNPVNFVDPLGLLIRAPTQAEEAAIQNAIARMHAAGYVNVAQGLEEALRGGRIVIDTDLEALGEESFQIIYLNPAYIPIEMSNDDLSYIFINTLAHEYVHLKQFETRRGQFFFGFFHGIVGGHPALSLTDKMAYGLADALEQGVRDAEDCKW
jgi:RHS repeat-associated protein